MKDPVTVLFVDDEQSLLRVIVRALRGSPFDVLTASSGAEALEVMRRRRVDVLVSDIDMPEMSGLDLVKIARREFPNTLRMLLTGAATLERTLYAVNEGEILRCFVKPFEAELFRQTLTGLVERVEKLRRDGELDARRARRHEFFAWVEERFPEATAMSRDEHGHLVIDVSSAAAAALESGSAALDVLLPDG